MPKNYGYISLYYSLLIGGTFREHETDAVMLDLTHPPSHILLPRAGGFNVFDITNYPTSSP